MGSDPGEQLKRLRDLAVHLICGFLLTLLVLIAYSAHAYIFELFLGRAKEKEGSPPTAPCLPQKTSKPARTANPKKLRRRNDRGTRADIDANREAVTNSCKAEINNANVEPIGKKEAEASLRPPDNNQRSDMPLSEDTLSRGQEFQRPRRVHPREVATPPLQNTNSKEAQN